jgi:hypothetical protein
MAQLTGMSTISLLHEQGLTSSFATSTISEEYDYCIVLPIENGNFTGDGRVITAVLIF